MYRKVDILILFGFTLVIALAAYFFGWVQRVGAIKPEPYKIICHHTPGNDVELEFVNQQAYEGHLGTPHNDQVYDTDGICIVSPVPSSEPTVTPEVTVTPDPTATPSATPTTAPGGSTGGDGRSDGLSDGRSSCPECTQAPVVVPEGSPNTGRAE